MFEITRESTYNNSSAAQAHCRGGRSYWAYFVQMPWGPEQFSTKMDAERFVEFNEEHPDLNVDFIDLNSFNRWSVERGIERYMYETNRGIALWRD